MFSRFPKLAMFAALLLTCGGAARAKELKVCSDPDNLPFSNFKQEGFENKIAQVVAADLGAELKYVWQRMGRGFVREYIDSGRCDALIGIPVDSRQLAVTSPYYRSTYVFVVRRDARVKPASLDDPNLRELRIGIQALDEQYAPPGEALVRRGLQGVLRPFYGVGSNATAILAAVADREVDTAAIWGPQAGFLAKRFHDALQLIAVEPEIDPPGLTFTFAIGMGVRKTNASLRAQLEVIVGRRQHQFAEMIAEYGVPLLELAPAKDKKEAD